jgi:hypothetical protein
MVDQTMSKMLMREFESYITSVYDEPISDDQRKEIQRAFFAGARIATSQIGNAISDKRTLARAILTLDTELNEFLITVLNAE